MKRIYLLISIAAISIILLLLVSCSGKQEGYVDGYYMAEVEEFDDHGWKEFITICVSGGKIVTVEYNAKNPSGMIKSWGMDYMRTMNAIAGSYPNQYTRAFGGDLQKNQNSDSIDAVSGATHSYHTFHQLAEAVLESAKNGNEQIVYIKAE